MSRTQNSFWTLPWPQKKHIRAQKAKKVHKIKSKSKVRIEHSIDLKSCSTTWVDPKSVFNPTPPQNCPLGPPKGKFFSRGTLCLWLSLYKQSQGFLCSYHACGHLARSLQDRVKAPCDPITPLQVRYAISISVYILHNQMPEADFLKLYFLSNTSLTS